MDEAVEIISGANLKTVSEHWDKGLPYIQDATAQERYERLRKSWKTRSRMHQHYPLGWEEYLARHSLFHYSKMAHCLHKHDEKYYSQSHWEMYLFYETILPLLYLRKNMDVARKPEIQKMMKRMYFGPREIGKSVAIRIALMWIKYQDPRLRTLYGKAVREDAEIAVEWMKTQYEKNRFIAATFPEYSLSDNDAKPKPWSRKGLMLPDITGATNRTSTEATFTAGGRDKTATGQHYDIFCPDDYVTEKNVESQAGRARTVRVLKEAFSVMGPTGLWLGCGTHWHQEDGYQFLKGEFNPDGDADGISFITSMDVKATTEGDAMGDAIFPDVLPIEYLKPLRRRIGPFLYSCLYDNDPAARSNTTFNMEDTRYFQIKHLETMGYKLPIHVIFDGSGDTKMSSDKCGIVVIALDHKNPASIYVLDCFNGRFTDSRIFETFEKIYDHYRGHRLFTKVSFWMQNVAFEGKYKKLIHTHIQPKRPGFHMQTLKRKTTIAKWQEIGALEPSHANGQVYLRIQENVDLAQQPIDEPKIMQRILTKGMKPLFKEMTQHLRGRRDQEDNCVDPLAQIMKIITRNAQRTSPDVGKDRSVPGQMRDQRQRRAAVSMAFNSRYKNGDYGDIPMHEAAEQYREDQGGDDYYRDTQLQAVG